MDQFHSTRSQGSSGSFHKYIALAMSSWLRLRSICFTMVDTPLGDIVKLKI